MLPKAFKEFFTVGFNPFHVMHFVIQQTYRPLRHQESQAASARWRGQSWTRFQPQHP